MKPHRITIIVPPGLEALAAEECRGLGLSEVEEHTGWLVTHGHDRWIHRLNNLARIPSRILVELASFRASSFSELVAKVQKARIDKFLGENSINLKISVSHCRLYHTGAIEERILRALGKEKVTEKDSPALELYVRGEDDEFTLSLDSSGDHLHRRGVALHRGAAPLRENLAAALVQKVSPKGAVWDPTCGSGTILLETILGDTGYPLNRFRSFAFEKWPQHNQQRYQADLEKMEEEVKPLSRRLLASDIDSKELEACRSNLERLGALDKVEVFQGDVSSLDPKDHLCEGSVLSNPPYGQRIGPGDDLMKHFVRWVGEYPKLGVHMVLPRGKDLSGFQRGLRFRNGGIGVATYHSWGKAD